MNKKIDKRLEVECAACGRIISFILNPANMWTYKKEGRYFCSYGCMRSYKRHKKPLRTKPKELPIVFKSEKVLNVLSGTMTHFKVTIPPDKVNSLVPPYITGDMLYVRETFKYYTKHEGKGEGCFLAKHIAYRADEYRKDVQKPSEWYEGAWTSAIHMKKDDVRIWLKVKSCKAIRLQDMKGKDFKNEGAANKQEFIKRWNSIYQSSRLYDVTWESNPWVWDVAFEVVEKN